jgi:hypothetical protein
VKHRTVRCASRATATSRATVDCNRIQCATVRARVRARASGAPDSVRCTRALEAELFTFGKFRGRSAIIHRTIRCASGATAPSRATVDCNRIQCATVRAEVRARTGGAPDSLQDLSGAPPDSPEAPQVRAPTVEPQRSADVAGAPDSVRCAMRQHTSNGHFWWLGL